MMISMLLAVAIFGFTYMLIMTEWINKMTAALLGGFLVVILRLVGQERAFAAVDWNVIFLLIGMMMVMSVLKETGIFEYLAIKTAKAAKAKPIRIMLFIFVVTAFVSAFLDNVTTVMMLVPIALLIASELKISPVPFIITMAIGSNIGGTATMIGDPPNIMIGSATDYTFIEFIYHLTPAILIIIASSLVLTWLLYHKKMVVTNENRARLMEYNEDNLIKNKKLLVRVLIVVGLMLTSFLLQSQLHLEISTIAMISGLILLIINNRKHVDQVLIHDIDWATILFFIGLFMLVESLISTGVMDIAAKKIVSSTGGSLKTTSFIILWFSGIFSAIVDNVPFVATMIPLIEKIGNGVPRELMHPVWWSLSLGACLGGNGTLIGASANVVSVGIANKNGFKISFMDFTKIGVIYTLNSLVISTLYIWIRYF
ncbi:MAG TPA: ArsB/NhaD family transporter [Candidatus Cloacimonadota bacterium]|nr:ArsB/NhaD family transporter [Candidatus Cloacimonadota bacterium]